MKLNDFEEWVVSESMVACWLEPDSAAARGFAAHPDVAGGVGQNDVAGVVGRPLFRGSIAELLEQPSIVTFVGCARAGIPSRVDARPTCEHVNRDAAVLAQCPGLQMPS